MKNGSISYTLSAQILDTVKEHGEFAAAKILKRRIDFTTYFMLRFGKAPAFTKA